MMMITAMVIMFIVIGIIMMILSGDGGHVYGYDSDFDNDRNRKGKKGNILFNDALNTFYFTVIWRQTYGKRPLR